MDLPENGKNTIEGGVPILITHHTVNRPPKVEISKKFVGWSAGFQRLAGNLILKAVELIDEAFWAEERNVIDKGDIKSVHYAIDIETDITDPDEVALVASKIDASAIPAAGSHFQVVKEAEAEETLRVPDEVLDSEGKNIVTAKATAERPRPRNTRAPRLLRSPRDED